MRTRQWGVGLIALMIAPTAYGVLDVCDGFGPLVGTSAIDATDRHFAGTAAGDYFGKSTVVGDFDGDGFDDLLVGAPGADLGARNAGAAFLFYGPITAGTKIAANRADVVFAGEGVGAQAGWSVANAGDVNGDGIDDMLIGSFGGTGTVHPAGAAHLVLGNPALAGASPLSTATAKFTGLNATDQFGSAVAGAGDVDGDGFDDIIIGASQYDAGAINTGAAWLYYGPVSGTKTIFQANATFLGQVRGGALGASVAGVGDTNGDGFDDIGIGAPSSSVPGVGGTAGIVGLFWGGSGGNRITGSNPISQADVIVTGTAFSRTGSSLSTAGDVNNDGRDDVWVGAKQQGQLRLGAAYLVLGTASGGVNAPIESVAQAKLVGVDRNDLLGSAVVGNVDFDNDGYLDVVVGAERGDGPGGTWTGQGWAVHGPFAGTMRLSVDTAARVTGNRLYDYAGSAVAGGDLNGDGFDDAIVGAWQSSTRVGGAARQGVVGLAFGGQDIADNLVYYRDADRDGFGNPSTATLSCTQPVGFILTGEDCNDNSAAFYPSAPEVCQGPDTNCDGRIGAVDNDNDGFTACDECNDNVAAVNPNASEVCGDNVDNDCDGLRDDGSAIDAVPWCPDSDLDGWGQTTACITACSDPGTFLVSVVNTPGDCDDRVASTHPTAGERCDLVDNDCDNVIDDPTAVDASTWFADADGDGAGTFWSTTLACTQPGGYVANENDCDDTSDLRRPGMTEVCDFVDNDCDGRLYLGGSMPISRRRASVVGVGNGDNLGSAVAFLADQNSDQRAELVVGAPDVDVGSTPDAGAVYILRGTAAGGDVRLSQLQGDGSPRWTTRITGTRQDGQLGGAVATGDVNGDGVGDLLIGAPTLAAPGQATGGVYLFFGPLATGDRSVATADAFIKGEASGDLFGSALALGDLDDDGKDDIIVTAPGYGGNDVGRTYVIYGTTGISGDTGVAAVPGLATFTGAATDDRAGSGVAVVDLDGDGFGDLVIGSGFTGSNDTGAVGVAFGGATRYAGASTASVTWTGASSVERVGLSVAAAGDINADGYDDLLIGTNAERAVVRLGGATRPASGTMASAASFFFQGDGVQNAGQQVAGAGDVDGDGYDDIVFSAAKDSEAANNAGAVYLIYGNTTAYFTGLAVNKELDLALVDSFGRLDAGSTFPTYSASNIGGVEGAKMLGLAASDQVGTALAGGADYNGDGRADFVAGARLADDGATANAGGAWVVSGGPYGTDDDAGVASQSTYYWDSDADAHANAAGTTFTTCPMHAPIALTPTPTVRGILTSANPDLDDCNDSNALVYTGATEVDNDGLDRDCDGYDSVNREVVGTTTLSPSTLYTDTTVTATASYTDPDGLAITITYKWYVDGVEVAGQTGNTLSSNFYDKGQTVTVEAYVNDVRQTWGPYTASSVVANSLPTLTRCSVTPSTGDRLTSFSVDDVGLRDADPQDAATLSVEYQWQQRFGPLWQDLPGQTAATLASCATRFQNGSSYNCSHGSELRASCRPSDGTAFGTTYRSSTVTITNVAPEITTCSLSPSAPTTTQDITVTATATDVDGDPVSIAYQWTKNGVVQSGITGTSFPHASQVHFDSIGVTCTPTDSLGLGGQTVTAASVDVVNTAPTAPSVDLTPNSPRSDQTLTVSVVSPSTDIDNDTITYRYFWTRNGSVFNNPTSPTSSTTVNASTTIRGDIFDVTVVPNDSYTDGPSATDSVTVQNTPPTIASAVLSPTTAYNLDDITVQGVSWFDDDGDLPSYNVAWYVNGTVQPAQTPNPLVLSNTRSVKGQQVYAVLTPKDTFGTGTSVTTSTITIQNSAPTTPVISITPSPPGENDNLTCNLTTPSTDADSDPITYTYAWYRNNTLVAGQTAQVINASFTTYADVFYCTARASDGTTTSGLATSATIAIQDLNAPDAPVISSSTRYSNQTSQTLTGTCTSGALDCNTMVMTCTGATTRTYNPTCTANAWSQVVSTDRGATTSCSMVCRDSSNSTSLSSNTAVMESCSPHDSYETSGTYGDSGLDPVGVVEFATLPDTNTSTITITGNILGEWNDTQDWYRIVTSDNAVANATAGANAYKLELVMGTGAASYDTWVYKNAYNATAACAVAGAAGPVGPYDDYTDDFADPGDAPNHPRQTANPNVCANASALYNQCTSMAATYFIRVMRASGTDCSPYVITAYNGR